MRSCLRIAIVAIATLIGGASQADELEVPVVKSDAWLRSGPSTAHSRITGLPRGTPVLEMTDMDTVFERRQHRWVQIHVLEGPAAGKQGWVWGQFIGCCEAHEWLE